MKVYISGKIGDLPDEIYCSNFKVVADDWRRAGHEVVNPCELPHKHDRTWQAYMLKNLAELSKCDGIVMLSNWMDSPGAKIEHAWAWRMGLMVFYSPMTPNEIEL